MTIVSHPDGIGHPRALYARFTAPRAPRRFATPLPAGDSRPAGDRPVSRTIPGEASRPGEGRRLPHRGKTLSRGHPLRRFFPKFLYTRQNAPGTRISPLGKDGGSVRVEKHTSMRPPWPRFPRKICRRHGHPMTRARPGAQPAPTGPGARKFCHRRG